MNAATTGSSIYTYLRYDISGNVVSLKDARGNVSTISFADDFSDDAVGDERLG